MRGQLLIQHNLFGYRHAATPLGGPVRHREARTLQFGEPPLLEGDELGVTDSGLGRAPIGRDVLLTPFTHPPTELVEVAHMNSPVSPRAPALRVNVSRVADNPSGSRRRGWLYRDSQDSVVSSQNPTAPCS